MEKNWFVEALFYINSSSIFLAWGNWGKSTTHGWPKKQKLTKKKKKSTTHEFEMYGVSVTGDCKPFSFIRPNKTVFINELFISLTVWYFSDKNSVLFSLLVDCFIRRWKAELGFRSWPLALLLPSEEAKVGHSLGRIEILRDTSKSPVFQPGRRWVHPTVHLVLLPVSKERGISWFSLKIPVKLGSIWISDTNFIEGLFFFLDLCGYRVSILIGISWTIGLPRCL